MRLLFGTTLLLSASLLFFVEPLFSRVVLPAYGGVPAVWSTCLVLFQTTLLLGYLYAHLLARALPLPLQALCQLALVWGGWALFAFGGGIDVEAGEPTLALGVAFAGSIGLPFFALAATTPLVQRWYSLPDHAHAASPYVFYAVSNLGSFFALLAYPLLAEPALTLRGQADLWSAGLLGFAVLISACALVAILALRRLGPRAAGPPPTPVSQMRIAEDSPDAAASVAHEVEAGVAGSLPRAVPQARSAEDCSSTAASPATPAGLRQRLRWLALAAIPSSLLLGATSHITTDVAAMPLLWVVPLALYLASFVLVFTGRPPLRHRWMLAAQPLTVLPILALFVVGASTRLWIELPLHLAALFLAAMVCHGELARSKPPASRLTEFYLWLAAGGCLGGLLTALAAPRLLDSVVEYPLMILAACLARPPRPTRHATLKVIGFVAALTAALLLLPVAWGAAERQTTLLIGTVSLLLVTSAGGVLLFHLLTTPRRTALVLGAIFAGGLLLAGSGRRLLHQQRSFFGTVRVSRSADGRFHLMHHGTTLHGAQHRERSRRAEPLTYFGRQGPLGDVFAALAHRPALALAVAGLGVGTIAAYARAGDRVTFYEIDRAVIDAARRAEWFSYLADCRGELRVIEGDARRGLAGAGAGAFSVIVQDAFSSDTIPVHLLTREALALYLHKLAPGGLLLLNITNRYVDLAPQLAASLADRGLVALIRRDAERPAERVDRRRRQIYPSTWVVAARRAESAALRPLRQTGRWQPLAARAGTRVWTDDYAPVLPYLK